VREVAVGLDAVSLGGLSDGKQARRGGGAGLAGREQKPFSRHDKGANRVVAQIVIQARDPVIQEFKELHSLVERIADGFAEFAVGGVLGAIDSSQVKNRSTIGAENCRRTRSRSSAVTR